MSQIWSSLFILVKLLDAWYVVSSWSSYFQIHIMVRSGWLKGSSHFMAIVSVPASETLRMQNYTC